MAIRVFPMACVLILALTFPERVHAYRYDSEIGYDTDNVLLLAA